MSDKDLGTLLAEVSKELSRVEKRGTAPSSMGGFKFVQETDVVEALKPLLDERGITLVPDVEEIRLDLYDRHDREGNKKDGPGVLATVRLAMHATRGAESRLLFRTVGQGADTQDKAPAKAITAAKKQGLLIAFSIPTGDDPEATDLEAGRGSRSSSRSSSRSTSSPAPQAEEQAAKGNDEDPPATQSQKNLIRAKAKEVGLSDEGLGNLRKNVTGKRSSKDFTNKDIDAMLAAMDDPALMAAAQSGGEVVE